MDFRKVYTKIFLGKCSPGSFLFSATSALVSCKAASYTTRVLD